MKFPAHLKNLGEKYLPRALRIEALRYRLLRWAALSKSSYARLALFLYPLGKPWRRLPILYRYIIRECFFPFMVGSAFFTLVFIVPRLQDLVAFYVEKSAPFFSVLQLFIFMIPFTAAITVPMGVLFGILLAFGNFSQNSEITAMRSCGISIRRIFLPAFMFGVVVTAGVFLFINYVLPFTNHRYKSVYRAIVYSNPGIMLEERVFTDIPNTSKKISTLGSSRDGRTMNSVFIYENDESRSNFKITYAETGLWLNNDLNSPLISLDLSNGRSLELSWNRLNEVQISEFAEFRLNILNQINLVPEAPRGPREQSWWEVWSEIAKRKGIKQDVGPSLWVELHKKFSIPAACLIFVIIGMPLGITFRRSGKGLSFGSAIVIIFTYYVFMTMGETMGKKQIIPAHLSMWIPNLLILSAGLFFFWRRARE